MAGKSCFHGRFLGPRIEFMHSAGISCERAAELFRAAAGIWERIGRRYGESEIEFWVIVDYNPENPVIASCTRHGVYFNFALWRDGLTPAEDTASRMIEELYHLHEWRVQGIEPKVPVHSEEKIALTYPELFEYYAQDYKFRALQALVEMTGHPHWKKFLETVERHRSKRKS